MQASSPVRIGTDSDWDRVYVYGSHTCALKTDSSLYCWGVTALGNGLGWKQEPVLIVAAD